MTATNWPDLGAVQVQEYRLQPPSFFAYRAPS